MSSLLQQSDWDMKFMSSSEEAEPVEVASVVPVSTEDHRGPPRTTELLLQAQGSSSPLLPPPPPPGTFRRSVKDVTDVFL